MSKPVRLENDDYLRLYPYWKPQQILEEFGKYSHCDSQIRNKYRTLKYGTQHQGFKSLVKVLLLDRPEEISLIKWKDHVAKEIILDKEKARLAVWKSLNARRQIWGESE